MPENDIDIFLKLEGIDGQSTVKGHEKEIDVLSYDQPVEVAVIQSGGGGGASAGKATFSGVRFRKNVDAASVPLALACASGQHLGEARFTFRLRRVFDFYIVTLEDVLVVKMVQEAGAGEQYPLSFDALNAGASSRGFLDQVTLRFSRIRWEHRTQRDDRTVPVVTATGGWDVTANKKL